MCKIVETILSGNYQIARLHMYLNQVKSEFGYVLHYKSLSVKSIQDFLSFVISNFTDKVVNLTFLILARL